MKTLVTSFTASLVTVLMSANAWASGGFTCQTKNRNMDFQVNGAFSHGLGAGLFQSAGALKGVMKAGAKKLPLDLKFAKDNVAQYWNSGSEFKLVIYTESDSPSFNETTIVLETKQLGDSENFKGTVEIRHFTSALPAADTKIKLPVICSLE